MDDLDPFLWDWLNAAQAVRLMKGKVLCPALGHSGLKIVTRCEIDL